MSEADDTLVGLCRALGLAIPLAETPRAALDPAAVHAALDEAAEHREALDHRLAATRAWEEATLAGRPEVVARILDLAASGRPPASRAGAVSAIPR
jgi:hypothetical protein